MGKLIVAFTLFVTASAFAVREARIGTLSSVAATPARPAPGPARSQAAPAPASVAPPPWVTYAAPPSPPAARRPNPPKLVVVDDPPDQDSGACVPEVIDRCPDSPDRRDDEDGCPEPQPPPGSATVVDRVVVVETIY